MFILPQIIPFYGTQFKHFPKTDLPLVCDMSSDIFSKEIKVADFDLIYAGAQKILVQQAQRFTL